MGVFIKQNNAAIKLLAVLIIMLPTLAAGQETTAELDPMVFSRVNQEAQDLGLRVAYLSTGEIRQAVGKQLLEGSEEIYVPSMSAANFLQAGRYWDGRNRHLDLKVGGQTFGITAGTRLINTDEGDVLLPVPVLEFDGDLWLPMVLVAEVIGPRVQDRVLWNSVERRLDLGEADYNVTRLKVEVLGRATMVHIYCEAPLGYRVHSPGTGLIELKIYGGEVDSRSVASSRRRGLVGKVSSLQHSGFTTVTMRVDELVGRYRSYTADEGREIVVVLEESQVQSIPDPIMQGHANVNLEHGPIDVTNDITVQTIIIDPGHGGHDMGAVGRRGILEKDVNLAVARELKRYLERESDLHVVLTRKKDVYLELAARAELANRSGGDIFISLHCNSWFNTGAHGLETYFLSPARSDWAKSVERAENAKAGGEPEDVDFIVWELVQNQFISSSSQLAETIQAHSDRSLGIPVRGVKQAGFRVLVGAYMPAVLVELGFLSNQQEERQLGDSTWQRTLAKVLGESVIQYRDDMGGRQEADASGLQSEDTSSEEGGIRKTGSSLFNESEEWGP